MIIIGELINASRKAIARAIKTQDTETIQQIATTEFEIGADYIDVNAGLFEDKEVDYLMWLVKVVQQAVDAPCCIDSPNPRALAAAIEVHRGTPIINSISLESERYDAIIPLIAGTDFKIVALCMSDKGMPEKSEDRLSVAETLINKLVQKNVKPENIFVDALVQPISINDKFGHQYLKSVEAITTSFPEVHTICGLSNISFGLPKRKLLNRTMAVMGIAHGLDSIICDPTDQKLMSLVCSAETLIGRDEYCGNYLTAYRETKLED